MRIYKLLEQQLKKEPGFVTDNGELKKWVVMSKARNFDEELLGLLLAEEELKEKFFVKVRQALVFDQNLFVQFLEQKNYLNDSFTRFKNKVGLSIDGKYLRQRNEVALDWPFKDCVLEGGQSREEQDREEVFFNEVLAQDEITQLLEPKVLSNARYFSTDGESPLKAFNRDSELNKKRGLPADTITDNLIIKGNNLLALHSLKEVFAGKVKLIYIDPPYNTGKDGFNYNDSFNESVWLTFMKNRLEVARQLMAHNGCLFISVDDKEFAELKILCDSIFGKANFLSDIIWNSTKSVTNTALISVSHTHTLVYMKDKEYFVKNRTAFRLPDTGEGFANPDNDPRGPWKADPFQVGGWRPNQQYEIRNPNTGKVYKPNEGCSWKNDYDNYLKLLADNRIVFGATGDSGPQRKRFLSEATDRGKVTKTIWSDLETTTNGTQHLKKLFGKAVFSNPKPEGFIKRIIELCTNENDIVLDYHLGSGTTVTAAHKMNRQYIGVEQMDYVEDVAVERLRKVIAGEKGGISPAVNWQGGGSFVYVELKKYNQYFTEQIQKAQSFEALLAIWDEMKAKSFLHYNVDIQKHEENMSGFKQLSIHEQKQHLFSLLDKNQLYVNRSSLHDQDFDCAPEEKQITLSFYNHSL